GRGTWFSDTRGSCGVDFSQDEMIVALNEAQQGVQYGPNSKCFQKIRVSVKGEPSKSVVVRVVDTCPHRYCSYGQLDLSQAAFKKFAPMSKGVLDLEWSFV
ncbi:MAG: RlpA-like double-psi beta-barrel-protein domain-containing protein-containing protein, partial [Linnemannia gamsii]